jgi:hypothetical protein
LIYYIIKEEFYNNRLLDLSEDKISELMIEDDEVDNLDLDDLDSLAVDKKPQIYQN